MNNKRILKRRQFNIGKIRLTLMAEWCSSALWFKSSSKNGMIEIEKLPKEIHILKEEVESWNDEWMANASIGLSDLDEDEVEKEKLDIFNEDEILKLRINHNQQGYEIAKKIKNLLKNKNFEVFYFDEFTNEKVKIN